MADPEIATKAPESDLQEEPISDDKQPLSANSTTPAASSTEPPKAQVSEHCTTDRPLPTAFSEAPSGTISAWTITPPSNTSTSTEVEVYVSKPADYPATPARLLLLLSNGTGIHSLNNQHQADLFARNGYLVVMPDLFARDPAPNSKPEESKLDANSSWLDTVKLKAAETAKSFMLDMWLARHTPETVLPRIQGVLEQARSEFADAVSHGDGIYAVGYCFGGKYALILAGEKDDSVAQGQDPEQGQVKRGPEIKAGVCAHGTLVAREDLQHIKAPMQLICVEDDPLFPADVLDHGRKWMAESGLAHDIEVYQDVPHGFAVVGEYESKIITDGQARAFDGMIKWLNKH